eukprot:TRINITY_DN19354_c0_g1_i2.p1 TRINITY_DN19354_c0_g1~~TRINITY_DN19354_c0_g1_i2.p1  ORF type:complete len:448 (+),score=44.27 TRINITY_DN19354_c0_g1_i2:968-2311(+)
MLLGVLCAVDVSDVDANPLVLIVRTIPYRIFPILMLLCPIVFVYSHRDFGLMLRAEMDALYRRRTSRNQKLGDSYAFVSEPDDPTVNTPLEDDEDAAKRRQSPLVGLIPLLVFLICTSIGMVVDGLYAIDMYNHNNPLNPPLSRTVANVIAQADCYTALMWGAFAGGVCSIWLATFTGVMDLHQSVQAYLDGVKDTAVSSCVLIAVWALAAVARDLHVTTWLAETCGKSIPCGLHPMIMLLLSYALSLVTGSYWGTAGTLAAFILPVAQESDCNNDIVLQCVACLFAGPTFGTICSPNSDLGHMVAAATGCTVYDHVSSQMLYCALAAFSALLFGVLPVGMGWLPIYGALPLSLAVVLITLYCFGFDSTTLDEAGPRGPLAACCGLGVWKSAAIDNFATSTQAAASSVRRPSMRRAPSTAPVAVVSSATVAPSPRKDGDPLSVPLLV